MNSFNWNLTGKATKWEEKDKQHKVKSIPWERHESVRMERIKTGVKKFENWCEPDWGDKSKKSTLQLVSFAKGLNLWFKNKE